MAGVFMNEGYYALLRYLASVGSDISGDCYLRLFTNNITPNKTDSTGSYTECTASGYAAVDLSPGNWVVSVIGSTVHATYPQQLFAFSSSTNIYGYFIDIVSAGILVCAEVAAGAPLIFGSVGGGVFVTVDIHGP